MTIISVSGNYTKIILEKSLFFNLLSKVSSTKSELYCKSLYFDYNSILEVKTSTKMTEGKKNIVGKARVFWIFMFYGSGTSLNFKARS